MGSILRIIVENIRTKNTGTHFLVFVAVIALGLTACREQPGGIQPQATADVRDSAYYKSLIFYLWSDNLPDYTAFNNRRGDALIPNDETVFKPRSFANLNDLMAGAEGIRKYSFESGSTQRLDRFSFATSQKDWENQASGSNTGYGFQRGFVSDNDLRVAFVFPSSPMGKAGIRRGWKMLKVNNIEGNLTNNTSISTSLGSANSSEFVFGLPDGTQKTVTVNKAAYTADFLLHKSIINAGGKKIGYLVLDSFLGSNDGKATADALTSTFNEFGAGGVQEMVVDLRYNGGGYVFIAEHFSNLLAPASAKGKTMYSYKRNKLFTDFIQKANTDSDPKNDIQNTIRFDNQPSRMNLSKVVFIVAGGTASASELLINNLKPYMDVKLVGQKTFGKPVGFPSLLIRMSKTDVSQNYYVFPVAFQTVNADGKGDYFNGIAVDKEQQDDVTRDFGDPQEACLKDAIAYLTAGSLPARTAARPARVSQAASQANRQLLDEGGRVRDMVEPWNHPIPVPAQ